MSKKRRPQKRPRRRRFFHRLRPPDEHHKNRRSSQRWRNPTGLKDTRRFPLVTPSCALLFLPFGLPVSLRCYGRVYLIPRLTLGSGKAVRSKLDCMHEPPVQSDRCVFSGNYQLESKPERHDKTPLAAAIGKQDVREMHREILKWYPYCGYTERTDLVTCLAQDCYLG